MVKLRTTLLRACSWHIARLCSCQWLRNISLCRAIQVTLSPKSGHWGTWANPVLRVLPVRTSTPPNGRVECVGLWILSSSLQHVETPTLGQRAHRALEFTEGSAVSRRYHSQRHLKHRWQSSWLQVAIEQRVELDSTAGTGQRIHSIVSCLY